MRPSIRTDTSQRPEGEAYWAWALAQSAESSLCSAFHRLCDQGSDDSLINSPVNVKRVPLSDDQEQELSELFRAQMLALTATNIIPLAPNTPLVWGSREIDLGQQAHKPPLESILVEVTDSQRGYIIIDKDRLFRYRSPVFTQFTHQQEGSQFFTQALYSPMAFREELMNWANCGRLLASTPKLQTSAFSEALSLVRDMLELRLTPTRIEVGLVAYEGGNAQSPEGLLHFITERGTAPIAVRLSEDCLIESLPASISF